MLACIREGKEGTYVDIHVLPGSKKESLSFDGYTNRLRVKISAPAVDGKANKALVKYLTGILGDCEIVSGATAHKKTILVRGLDAGSIDGILTGAIEK